MPPWVGLVMFAVVGLPFLLLGMILGSLLTLFAIYRRPIGDEARRIYSQIRGSKRPG